MARLQIRERVLRQDRIRTAGVALRTRDRPAQHRSRRAAKRGDCGSSCVCPFCGGEARFQRYAERTGTGLPGPVRVTWASSHCSGCSASCTAHHATLQLDRRDVTPAVRERAALVGIEAAFPTAAHRLLERTSGVLSESSIRRLTEETGERHEAALPAGRTLGEAVEWEWSRDTRGRMVADVEADATGVPLPGPGGQAREGQMVYLGAIVRRADAKANQPSRIRYVTHGHELAPLGEKLHRQAAVVGMDRADRWIALTDGEAGLESFRDVKSSWPVRPLSP